MPERPGRRNPSRFFIIPLLSISSALLLSLAQASPLVPDGLGFLAWLALVPLFCLQGMAGGFRARPRRAALRGGAAGIVFGLGYALASQTWIASWHPLGLLGLALLEAGSYGLVMALGGLASSLLPRLAPFLLPFLWLGGEYVRSQGSLGMPLGLLGLSQYLSPTLVSLASLGGLWLVSLFVAAFNSILGASLPGILKKPAPGPVSRLARLPSAAFLFSLGGYALLLALALGVAAWPRPSLSALEPGASTGQTLRLALIQHAPPYRQDRLEDYEGSFAALKAQTEAALAGHPQLIVWPETALVPSLNWHLERRLDREVADFALRVDTWMRALPCPILYGNDLAELRAGEGPGARLDWNAAIILQGGQREAYKKTRLVPFAEEVPAALGSSRLASLARARSGGDWQRGSGPQVLELEASQGRKAILLGTPICFEDCFGAYCAGFARAGASCLIVLTSDAWAHSRPAQNQHLAQSVFRAAETGLPVLRAASTGETAYIGPGGQILARLAPGEGGFLLVELPIPSRAGPGRARTPYLALGDSWPALGLGISLALILAAVLRSRGRKVASH